MTIQYADQSASLSAKTALQSVADDPADLLAIVGQTVDISGIIIQFEDPVVEFEELYAVRLPEHRNAIFSIQYSLCINCKSEWFPSRAIPVSNFAHFYSPI